MTNKEIEREIYITKDLIACIEYNIKPTILFDDDRRVAKQALIDYLNKLEREKEKLCES